MNKKTSIKPLFFVILLYSNFVSAHPELMLEQIDENETIAQKSKYEIDPETGKVKFEIKPNFLKGSPVHEKMTQASITLSNVHERSFMLRYDLPYLKGIYWNDDPEQMLCPWCDYFHIKKWGPEWALRFLDSKEKATRKNNPIQFSNGDPLLSRSHFGDLQFIHAMAYKEGIPAKETLSKILLWAEFTYKVGIGQIPGNTKIKDVPIEGFKFLFDKNIDIYNGDIASLFHDRAVRRIALGSLLHLIQDSYSLSHVDRNILDKEQGRFCRSGVKIFHSYSGQDTNKHAQEDKWPANLAMTTKNNLYCDPITIGSQLLSYYAKDDFRGESWNVVKDFLTQSVFSLNKPNVLSRPGEEFLP